MRTIAIALLAAGLMMPGTAAAIPVDATSVLAQATTADQPAPKKKKAKRKRAPKAEYMRAVPSR
jgi:hypothetical protein